MGWRDDSTPIAPTATTQAQTPAPSVPWFSLTGNDKVGEFVGKMADSATAGFGASILDKLGIGQGPGGQTVRSQVEQAGQDIGPLASGAADVAGYAVGPGKFKLAAKLAEAGGGRLLARVGGSAVEGGLSSGAGALGHGESTGDALKAATAGAIVGGVTGTLPGGGGPRSVTPSTADLKAASKQAFAPLESMPVNPSQVESQFNRVSANMTPGDRASIGTTLNSKINDITREISGTNSLTADDVAKFQRTLTKSARGDADQRIAQQYSNALDTALGPAQPHVAAANRADNIYKTSRDIDKWAANPDTAPKMVASALAKRPAFYQSQPGLFDALNKVGQMSGPPSMMQQLIRHGVSSGVGAATGAGLDYALGGNPASGAVEGALTGAVYPRIAAAHRAAPVTSGLAAARHLAATGQDLGPAAFRQTSPWLTIPGSLARTGGYAWGASGQ
jgi:hypothetical protein